MVIRWMNPRIDRKPGKTPLIARSAAIVALCAFTSGCPARPASRKTASIFGKDQRLLIHEEALPWKAIGRVLDDNGHARCSGTLVGGNLVLTAAHCLVFDQQSNGHRLGSPRANDYFFQPFGSTEKIRMTQAILGTNFHPTGEPSDSPDPLHQQDWALLILEQDAGDRFGYLEVRSLPDDWAETAPVSAAGYAVDLDQGESLAAHLNCRILTSVGPVYQTDCAVTDGESGGPLLVFDRAGKATVVGVLSYEISDNATHYDAFVRASSFQNDVAFARQR